MPLGCLRYRNPIPHKALASTYSAFESFPLTEDIIFEVIALSLCTLGLIIS